MTLDLLIFDFDGVLSDSEGLSCTSLVRTLGELGIILTEEEVEARYTGMGVQHIIDAVEASEGVKLPDDFQGRNWAMVKALMESGLQSVPHAREMLGALPANLPRCIASNSFQEWIDTALAITGLDTFFDPSVRFNADMVTDPKPSPDLHRHVLAAMGGTDPAKALIIEDTVTGLGGGKAAGIEVWGCVAVSPHRADSRQQLLDAGATLVIDDLRELPGLISQRFG